MLMISAPVPAPVITSSTACISLGTLNTVIWNPAATPWLEVVEVVEGESVTVRWREDVERRRGEVREWQEVRRLLLPACRLRE